MGIASRRQAEKMILEGRVTLNGKKVSELGTKINPEADHLKIDGKLVKLENKQKVYIALNKPRGCITTSLDEENRPTIYHFLEKKVRERVFPIGRLDCNSEGLLLLTNDGDMCEFLTRPKNSIERVYEVKIQGTIDKEVIARLNKGVRLDDGWFSKPKIKFLKKMEENCWVEVSLRSGKNREVRRIFNSLGYNVLKLKRIMFAAIELGSLKTGDFRYLTLREINSLKKLARRKPENVSKEFRGPRIQRVR